MPPRPTADPDEQALRRAVCASPDDDLPRLVFADYLEERDRAGDGDRAGFIRAQCEMARAPAESKRWRTLARTEAGFWRQHRAAWEAELPARASLPRRFERGFVAGVTAPPDVFLRDGEAMQWAAPVTDWRVGWLPFGTNTAGMVSEAVAAPAVARLRRFDCSPNQLAGLGVEVLAAAGHLTGLRDLAFGFGTRDGPAAAGRAVAAVVRGLPGLQRVRVSGNGGFPASLAGLAAEPAARRLTRLDLQAVPASLADVVTVAESPHFAGLRRFDLPAYRRIAGVAPVLAASRTLAELEVLDLSGCPLADADVRLLGGAAFAPTLRVLVLRRCGLSRAGRKRFDGLFPRAEVVF